MSSDMVTIPREAYTALEDKIAFLDKYVENLMHVVTRDADEILTLKLDLSYAKAQMDTLYQSPASGIQNAGVGAVLAAAIAAAEKKPEKKQLDPPAASSPKEPLGVPSAVDSAATAGNDLLIKTSAGPAGPPAAPPLPACGLKNYQPKPKTVIDAGAAAGGPAKDKLQRPKEPNTTATPNFMAEMAAKQALRAQNGAANNAVDCREKQLEAARQAKVDYDARKNAHRAPPSKAKAKAKTEEEVQAEAQAARASAEVKATLMEGLKKFESARDGSDSGDWSDSGGEDDEKTEETVQTPTVAPDIFAQSQSTQMPTAAPDILAQIQSTQMPTAAPNNFAPRLSTQRIQTVANAGQLRTTAAFAAAAAAPEAAPTAAASTASADPEAAPADHSDLM